ncbi:hypothetical protein [Rhodococcus erythropolis]|uniref:hypothetical protein n=1 Tax=Rhodococcus erythropolis TaxID=1833 RepID=UPI0036730E63
MTAPDETILDITDLPTLRKLHEFFEGYATRAEDMMKQITFEMYAAILGDFIRDIEGAVSS